jgi:hypothetical protein
MDHDPELAKPVQSLVNFLGRLTATKSKNQPSALRRNPLNHFQP